MSECILDCEKCSKYENCETVNNGYLFLDGTIAAEPMDRDEYGNIMDETWYTNMANYGVPYTPKEL